MLSALLLLAAQAPLLDRGVVAVHADQGVAISWRLLPEDHSSIAFHVYRHRRDEQPERLTERPLDQQTFWLDRDGQPSDRYSVRTWVAGRIGLEHRALMRQDGLPLPYLSIPLRPVPGYTANDGAAGDLDGDGTLELVVMRVGVSRDNSHRGMTDPPMLEAYRLDGRFLWRIELGKNIRSGAHYTQFLVYDLDGDGRAEVTLRTSDGTRDGVGNVIGEPNADHRNSDGIIIRGPEFVTVFDGRTGAALDSAPYIPARHPTVADPTPQQTREIWGDDYGNRMDRFLACVAYLDGKRPSAIFARGIYTRTVLAAWDFRDGRLRSRWVFDSLDEGNRYYEGQGFHSLSVADVDGDGRDEVVYGSCVIDDDGRGLHTTRLGHGDALHVGDFDPLREGLEVFAIHERPMHGWGATSRDAGTGEVLWRKPADDVGRGVAADIDPRHPGAESWTNRIPGLWNARGEEVSTVKPPSCNFAIWWDGDGLRELLDGIEVTKWDWNRSEVDVLLRAEGSASNNGTKATPVLSADILGDWREEVIWRSEDGQELRLYVSPFPTPYRLPTLWSDRQYRMAVVWQNVGYNQPPHPSFDMMTRLRLTP